MLKKKKTKKKKVAFTLVNIQESEVLAIQHWTLLVTAFQNDQKGVMGQQ